MLVNLQEILAPAVQGRYGVGLFNTVNLEMTRGVLAAAEETRSPVMIGPAEVLLRFTPLEELAYFLVPMARKANVPVVVHFDHGLAFETCVKALHLGFTSIMYDCSQDSLSENIRKVRELTRVAHALGASVEAELGHVGSAADSVEGDDEGLPGNGTADYTDPDDAEVFVRETGVDALAVAVGSAHGTYRRKPRLDFDRIRAIAARTGTPLVLHGGSGLSDDDFRRAIACGISKINIFTDNNMAMAASAAETLQKESASGLDLMMAQIHAVTEASKVKMRLFGCCGRA